MPTFPPLNGDTGYVYIEAYPFNAPSDPAEAGIFYNKTTDHYADYISDATTNGQQKVGTLTIADGDQVGIQVWQIMTGTHYPYTVESWNYEIEDFTTSQLDDFQDSTLPPGMNRVDCCLFTRMTTIGQRPNINDFSDGSRFANIAWIAACTCWFDQNGFEGEDGWVGSQNFPPNPSKIEVHYVDTQHETDTIFFCDGVIYPCPLNPEQQ